jgi:two-component system, NarL family, nitrate/nitrite response regulator NarL
MPRTPAPEAASVTPLRRPLGVVVVDALPVVVAGLARLIDEQPDLEVLATAHDHEAALLALGRIRRSRVVSLVGLGLDGDLDAGWVIRTVRERFPSHAVLALGANADAAAVSRALFVGADGYVDKNVAPERFLDAIRRASRGDMVLEGPETADLGDIAVALDRRRDIDTILTSRELQVLTVAAEGLTAKQIADRLGVRERTVTTHLGRIYGKLGVGSRLAAIRTATRSGLVGVALAE